MIRLKGEQVDTTFLIHVLSSLRLANKLRLSSVQNNWGSKEFLSFEHCSVSTPKTHKFLYCQFKNHYSDRFLCLKTTHRLKRYVVFHTKIDWKSQKIKLVKNILFSCQIHCRVTVTVCPSNHDIELRIRGPQSGFKTN